MKPKILIVDDHEIVREGIHTLITRSRADWQICGMATCAREAIELIQSSNPDLVVMDITMPGMSGLEAAAYLTKTGFKSRILMFTMHDFERLSDEVRAAGAHGFVLKSQAAKDLIIAMETLLSGGTFFSAPPKTEPTPDNRSNPGISFRWRLVPALA